MFQNSLPAYFEVCFLQLCARTPHLHTPITQASVLSSPLNHSTAPHPSPATARAPFPELPRSHLSPAQPQETGRDLTATSQHYWSHSPLLASDDYAH